jgi:molecular chaperone Hsp33
MTADDRVRPFQIDASGLRGRLVRLGPVIDTVLSRHAYPRPVALLLAEMLALAATLASALKYDGIFTLQVKGEGAIRLLVADVTSGGDMRGYAQFDAAAVAALPAGASVPRAVGAGYLAFTVDQGEHTERYQGIVELLGATLVDCIHHYFRQSEQFQAGINLAVSDDSGWRAGALMVQRLPPAPGDLDEDAGDDWRQALALMASIAPAELLSLPGDDLLYRLFHESGVRVYAAHDLRAGCRCSRQRVEAVLRSFPPVELDHYLVEGRIEVTCEFCNSRHSFAPDELTVDELTAGGVA